MKPETGLKVGQDGRKKSCFLGERTCSEVAGTELGGCSRSDRNPVSTSPARPAPPLDNQGAPGELPLRLRRSAARSCSVAPPARST